jgi:hypothetical protein
MTALWMERRFRRRASVVLGLMLIAMALLVVDGCSTVLGIGDLPIDAGSDGTLADARVDSSVDAGCHPACSGSTPYCLSHTCVECKPNSVGCNAAGAPQECNAGGVWVPAPACGTSTPYCLGGACVQCTPTIDPPECIPEAGLKICDAGVFEVVGCPCANNECQAWPTGKMGDCRFDAGTVTRYDPGFVLDCKSLYIDVDAMVLFEPPEGGAPTPPAWSIIGVVDNATINGTIAGQVNALGTDSVVKVVVPASDGGPGETLTYTLVQAEGGAGGSAGWNCSGGADLYAEGGAPAFGNGGGGAAEAIYIGNGEALPQATSCPTSCGTGTAAEPGKKASLGAGGYGTPAYGQDSGAEGAPPYGEAGANSNAGASGGGGGSRGRHGGLVYMRVIGALSGTGSIILSGQSGGPGGLGVATNGGLISTSGTCIPPLGDVGVQTFSGGASGGGGAGGAGGVFLLSYPGDAGAFLARVVVAGGSGGSSPALGGNYDNQPGAPGAAGFVEAGPIPP